MHPDGQVRQAGLLSSGEKRVLRPASRMPYCPERIVSSSKTITVKGMAIMHKEHKGRAPPVGGMCLSYQPQLLPCFPCFLTDSLHFLRHFVLTDSDTGRSDILSVIHSLDESELSDRTYLSQYQERRERSE